MVDIGYLDVVEAGRAHHRNWMGRNEVAELDGRGASHEKAVLNSDSHITAFAVDSTALTCYLPSWSVTFTLYSWPP